MEVIDDGDDQKFLARMERQKIETANNTLGPAVTRPVLVKPGKLLMWAKAGMLDPKLLPERLKETMLRLSTADTMKIIGDTKSLDDVLFAFEIQRVDGARVPILRKLLDVERTRDVPRKKFMLEIKAEIDKALGIDASEAKRDAAADAAEKKDNETGGGSNE